MISQACAEKVVRGWLADGLCGAIKDDEIKFLPFMNRIRPWLSKVNVLASNALWDSHPNKAYALIMKHGFADNRKVDKPSPAEHKKDIAVLMGQAAWREFKNTKVKTKHRRI